MKTKAYWEMDKKKEKQARGNYWFENIFWETWVQETFQTYTYT